MRYGYIKQLDCDFHQAAQRTRDALSTEGFGVLSEIDVQATLKKKLDLDRPRYLILGACNPQLAHRALEAEPHIGLLLPCNLVVREADDGVEVSIAKPEAMFQLVDNPALGDIAEEVDQKLQRVLDRI